jgi:hypothetical protein
MHLPEDGHKWLKHVGGMLCLSYEILLYVYVHLLFLLSYLIVIMFKVLVPTSGYAIVIVLLAQPRWWMVFPVPSLLFEFSQSAF